MQTTNRNFIIFFKHRRLKRLWQFFFTGWGLVMVVALIAGALFSKQLLWSPISAINLNDITTNQFKMTGASFAGTDKNGNMFTIYAKTGRQEYERPDIILLDIVSGTITRTSEGTTITDKIAANSALFNKTKKTITLMGNVAIDSSNGDRARTKELVIKL